MSSLIELFQKSFTSISSNELAEATKAIESQYSNEGFYQACIEIIIEGNNQISMDIKKAALIGLTNGIKTCWEKNFDENLKLYLFNHIPELLAHAPIDLLRLQEKLSDKIIDLSLFNDNNTNNNTYLIEILPQLFQGDINYQRSALIISKSVCRRIKNPKKEMKPIYNSFVNLIFPIIATLFQECNDFVLLNFSYHCLYRLIWKPRKGNIVEPNEITEQMIQNYGSIYYEKFMNSAGNVPNPINDFYIKFLIEGIKFLSTISKRLNNEQIGNIFQFLQGIFQLPAEPKLLVVKAKAIFLLNSIIVDDGRYELFESNMQLIVGILFSQLMISDEDINKMESDPEAFIQENSFADPNWDDIKASCCNFISKFILKSKSSKLIEFLYQIASSSLLQSNSRNQIFASFCLLSTVVSKKCSAFFNQFLPYLCQAANHPDFVVRVGSFFVLSKVSNCHIPREVIEVCISHLNDPVPIVCYYSALALSQSLFFSRNQPEYQEYKEIFSPQIDTIYSQFMNISSQFNDSCLSEALSNLVNFFDDKILPYVMPIFDKVISAFVESSLNNESELSGLSFTSSDALQKLIKLVGDVKGMDLETSIRFYSHFYSKLVSALEATANCDTSSLLFPLLSSLVNYSPVFDQSFWGLLGPATNDIDEAIQLIENLIFKDTDLVNRTEIVINLCQILLSSELILREPTFCSSLIMRCGPNLPCINEIISCIKNTAPECNILHRESICNIVSAIFLTFEDYSSIFEGGDMSLLNIWISEHKFPLYVASLLKIFNSFENDSTAQAHMLRAAFESIMTSGDDEEIDDIEIMTKDDDSDDELFADFEAMPGDANMAVSSNPQWFDPRSLMQNILNLMTGLQNAGSPVIQVIGQDEFLSNMNMISEHLNPKELQEDLNDQ